MTITFYPAGTIGEMKPGQMKQCQIGSHNILLANVDDSYFAVDNLCTHEDAPLYLGCMKGDLVQCSLHGGKFNVKTGEPAEEPAEIALKTYPVEIRNETILIGIE